MVRVRVLGELALEVDGNAVELPASRRARSLLGLLAVERRGHARSQVAARFWPEVLDESARTSLRSALSALRKALATMDQGGAWAGVWRVAIGRSGGWWRRPTGAAGWRPRGWRASPETAR
jgi:hypothetical protein